MRHWPIITAILPLFCLMIESAWHADRDVQFVAAAGRGDIAAARAYLDQGVGSDAVGADGRTALEWAAMAGHADMVRLLLDHGADPKRAADEVGTDGDHTHILILLQGAGAHVAKEQGVAALCYAVQANDRPAVDQWLRQGVDINQNDSNGMPPLLYAVFQGDPSMCEYLEMRGANRNAHSLDGRTALMHAVIELDPATDHPGRFGVLLGLLHHGADINAQDDEGKNALMHCIDHWGPRSLAVMQLLLARNPNLNLRNRYGSTALRYAQQLQNSQAVDLLQKAAARQYNQAPPDKSFILW